MPDATGICSKNINYTNGDFKEIKFLEKEIMELQGQNSEEQTTDTLQNMNFDLNHK